MVVVVVVVVIEHQHDSEYDYDYDNGNDNERPEGFRSGAPGTKHRPDAKKVRQSYMLTANGPRSHHPTGNNRTHMSQPAPSSKRFTYSDYRTWPEGERWELIDGEAYDMSPAPTRRHQGLLVELVTQVHSFLRARPCEAYAAPFDVRLPHGDETDDATETVVQPDLSVICDPDKLDDKGCRGAPDWIIEVLSPRTAAKDQTRKRDIYERHGVREYWLVHPTDRVLTIYELDEGAYGKPRIQELKGETPVNAIDGLVITWPQAEPTGPLSADSGTANPAGNTAPTPRKNSA